MRRDASPALILANLIAEKLAERDGLNSNLLRGPNVPTHPPINASASAAASQRSTVLKSGLDSLVAFYTNNINPAARADIQKTS